MEKVTDFKKLLDYSVKPVTEFNLESHGEFIGIGFAKAENGMISAVLPSSIVVIEIQDIDPSLVKGDYFNYVGKSWGRFPLNISPPEILTNHVYSSDNEYIARARVPIANIIDLINFASRENYKNELRLLDEAGVNVTADEKTHEKRHREMMRRSRIIMSSCEDNIPNMGKLEFKFDGHDFVAVVDPEFADKPILIADDSYVDKRNIVENQLYWCEFVGENSKANFVNVVEPYAKFKLGIRPSLIRSHDTKKLQEYMSELGIGDHVFQDIMNIRPNKIGYGFIRQGLDMVKIGRLSDISGKHILATDEFEMKEGLGINKIEPVHVMAWNLYVALKTLTMSGCTYAEINIPKDPKKKILVKTLDGKHQINAYLGLRRNDKGAQKE